MTQTSNRFYDRVARLMNDAASVAQGVRREATTMVRGQAERIAADMDLVKREDFEAVKEMARLAREENAKLEARIAALEAKLGGGSSEAEKKKPAAAKAKTTRTASSGTSASGAKTTRRRTSSGASASKTGSAESA